MGTALFSVMPDTLHLWCKWHVLRKAPESFGPVYRKNSEFRYQFLKLVNAMLTPDEFESAWEAMVVKYDLRDHPFMTRIYECREKWAKPFSNDKFCARMMSTQRVESANHMLKTYVPRNSPMNRFVLQYNNLLFDRGVEEDREEHMTKQVKTHAPCRFFHSHPTNRTEHPFSGNTTDEEVVAQNVAGATACCKDLHKGCI
jgi:hypothetical protein